MKKLIFAFLLLLFAIWLGYLIHRDPGYILITYHNWSIETSLWIGLLIAVLSVSVLYFLIRLFRHTSRLNIHFQAWRRDRRERKAGLQTQQAFIAFIDEDWKQAELLFSKSAENSTSEIINLVAAAYCAEKQDRTDMRTRYLEILSRQENIPNKSIRLIQSYFYLNSNQTSQAVATLKKLHNEYPKHPAISNLLAEALEQEKSWTELFDHVLEQEKQFEKKKALKLLVAATSHLLKQTHQVDDYQGLRDKLPKSYREAPDLVLLFAESAQRLQLTELACKQIENALKHHWDNRLINLYGRITSPHTHKQLHHAETWLKQDPNNISLLLCAARLSIAERLWGKAESYLNQAKDLNPKPEIFAELGNLSEKTNNPTQALSYYRKALL